MTKTCPRCGSKNIGRYTDAKIKEAVDFKKICVDCNFQADFW